MNSYISSNEITYPSVNGTLLCTQRSKNSVPKVTGFAPVSGENMSEEWGEI